MKPAACQPRLSAPGRQCRHNALARRLCADILQKLAKAVFRSADYGVRDNLFVSSGAIRHQFLKVSGTLHQASIVRGSACCYRAPAPAVAERTAISQALRVTRVAWRRRQKAFASTHPRLDPRTR